MFKRFVKLIGFIPVLVITFPLEILVWGTIWLVIGKKFPDRPIIDKFLFDW
jgi:hypothetical protein